MTSRRDEASSSRVEVYAGLSAGIAATLVSHPLDVIKTRLQLQSHSTRQAGQFFGIIRDISRNEHGLSGFYRGLTPNLIGNSVSWALYFASYAKVKEVMRRARGAQDLSYADYFLASGLAGCFTAICTNPIWVIKTRMLSTSATHQGAYASFADGVGQIFRREGLLGFYRGMVPSLIGVSHGAFQFMAYERMKLARQAQKGQVGLDALDILTVSCIAKAFAGSITYPYQVIRARLQMYEASQRYTGLVDVIAKTWHKEGILGFYKGLGPNLLRLLPSTGITFIVYEEVRKHYPGPKNTT